MKEETPNQSTLPPGWNKTTDDLLKELHERGSIPHQELEWAEYELGLNQSSAGCQYIAHCLLRVGFYYNGSEMKMR